MKYLLVVLLVSFSVLAEEPKVPEPSFEVPLSLTQDETQFVKDQYHTAIVNTAIQMVVSPRYHDLGGFLVETIYNDNAVAKLLITKSKVDLKKTIFESLYKDGSHKYPDLGSEQAYIRQLFEAEFAKDKKFFDELVATIKGALKK